MERALKERIIGAVVLVLIVVLVVPVFLDGPPAEGETVTRRVLLPGQDEQTTKTVVLERGRSVPVPAAETPLLAETESPAPNASNDKRQVTIEKLPRKLPKEPPRTSPGLSSNERAAATVVASASSSTGMWAVQLGSFSVRENAEKLAADLRKQGYAAFLSQMMKDGTVQHRVRVGPQKDRAGAESTAAKLLQAKHKGQVVPHP